MKLTKFAQSCILLETDKNKILVDPGFIQVNESTIKSWMNPDYIFVTHKHMDHFDEATVQKIVSKNTKIFATKETASAYPNTKFEIIKEGQTLTLGKIKVEVVHAEHGYTPLLKGGKEVKEGVGLIFNINAKRIYHTSDTICFPNDYKCDVILLPFNNHGVCMSPFEAALFAKETNAELIIPIHYDNSKLPGDVKKMEEELTKNNLNFKFLKISEGIEL